MLLFFTLLKKSWQNYYRLQSFKWIKQTFNFLKFNYTMTLHFSEEAFSLNKISVLNTAQLKDIHNKKRKIFLANIFIKKNLFAC